MVKHNCLNVSEQVIDILYILPKFDVIYDSQLSTLMMLMVRTVQIQREEMKLKTSAEKQSRCDFIPLLKSANYKNFAFQPEYNLELPKKMFWTGCPSNCIQIILLQAHQVPIRTSTVTVHNRYVKTAIKISSC